MAYVYLIGWTKPDIWYYGMRSANKKAPKDDLWKTYFTSSRSVHKFREKVGEPDHIEIVFESSDVKECREKERELLLQAIDEICFLNKVVSDEQGNLYCSHFQRKKSRHQRSMMARHKKTISKPKKRNSLVSP